MTTKDIDPKIIDAIAHIQASDEGTAYDSITTIMDHMHISVDDIDAAIYHGYNRIPCLTSILMAMPRIRLLRAVIPGIEELTYQTRPENEIAKDIIALLHKYTSNLDDVIDSVINILMWCEPQIIPYILPYLLSRYAPPSDIVDTLGDLWTNGIIGGAMGRKITLYRGVCDLNNGLDDAYSYTTDYEMAKEFAVGRYYANSYADRCDAGKGKIYTVQVSSEYIIGQCDDRNESEVLVLPPAAGGKVKVIKVEDV